MLQRPLLTPLVVGFWLVSTGWLVVAKILPALNPGSPPGHQALYTAGSQPIPVAWTVLLHDRPAGWAFSTANRTDDGGLVVDSHLRLDRVPFDDMLPAWAGTLVRRASHVESSITFDARGRLTIDPFGHLQAFSSRVDFPGMSEQVLLAGTVDEGKVSVALTAGGIRYETSRHLPTHMMFGDELSPQATLPGLYEGRRWTVPIFSPLRPGQSPIEILHAEVGPQETMFWENDLVRVHVVCYREDPTSGREPRCRMWVDLSGRVLKQEAAIVGTRMAFLRRTDEAAAWLADTSRSTAGRGPAQATVEAEPR